MYYTTKDVLSNNKPRQFAVLQSIRARKFP